MPGHDHTVTKKVDNLVEFMKRIGWVKSVLATVLTGALAFASIYSVGRKLESDVGVQIDKKIEVHALQSAEAIDERFDSLEMEQAVANTKLDMILDRLPE